MVTSQKCLTIGSDPVVHLILHKSSVDWLTTPWSAICKPTILFNTTRWFCLSHTCQRFSSLHLELCFLHWNVTYERTKRKSKFILSKWSLFLYFSLFNSKTCSVKIFAIDWIRTADRGKLKQPLCQLNHKLCPNGLFLHQWSMWTLHSRNLGSVTRRIDYVPIFSHFSSMIMCSKPYNIYLPT